MATAPPNGPPIIALPPSSGTFPPSSGTSGNPSQANPSQIILVNGPKAANPLDLIYNVTLVNPIIPVVLADFVQPQSICYHGGYNKVAVDAIKFFDCDNLVVTSAPKEVVSDFRTKGIMELRGSNGKYYWDEVYTTPLGLYLYEDTPISLGDLYRFNLTAPNKIKLHTEDPNIIPKVDDYFVMQRFFDINTFTNDSTTDDLNNVLVYPKGEMFQYKILSVAPTTGAAIEITSVDLTGTNVPTQIHVYTGLIPHGLVAGDKINIGGVVGIPDANGTFVVDSFDLTLFEFSLTALDGTTAILGSGVYVTGGVIKVLPLYELEFDKTLAPIGSNATLFTIASVNFLVSPPTPLFNNQIEVTTTALHRYSTGTKVEISGVTGFTAANGTFFVYVTSATTFALFSDAQLTNPVLSVQIYISGGIVNEFPAKYVFTLLNRMGSVGNQELFTDTWRQTEIHRQQLLGDPFLETSILKFVGHKNYLNYSSSGYLGMKNLLSGIIETAKTPFVIFDIMDDIKDRLFHEDGAMELHLPGIMLQGENTTVVLKNKKPILDDISGEAEYTGLYFVDAANSAHRTIRYGWVMHELRIVVIDHPELTTALGYNSNRNYTLPDPSLKIANSIQNPTNSDPLTIANVQATTPVVITTTTPHGLKAGDKFNVTGIQPNYLLPDGIYYVGPIGVTATTFKVYLDSNLTIPAIGTGAFTGGGTLVGFKLPYEYFVTYRLNGKHYNTAPYAVPLDFNFDVNNELLLLIPQMTHLVDGNNFEGFEANTLEVVIGKYKQDPIDSIKIIDNEYVVIAPAVKHKYNGVNHALTGSSERRRLPLKDASGNQIDATGHLITISRTDIEDVFGDFLLQSLTTISPFDYTGAPVAPALQTANILYDLVTTGLNTAYDYYNTIYGVPIYYEQIVLTPNTTLSTGDGIWTLGFLRYKQQAMQYRLTMRMPIPAGKWNGSTNPSYEPGNSLMKNKLITEVSFLIDDPNGSDTDPNAVIETPYIYGKISPALEKNNSTDLSIEVSIDF